MRKMIIDTDTGSDDAVALIMALKSKDIDVIAVTTVSGNVSLDKATNNALMTIEICKTQTPPVYKGAAKPLFRDPVTAMNVHGNDGMGDCNLIHPTLKAESETAVQAILRLVKEYPNEIDIVAIGPVTNIALAIMTDPETMKKVRHIYSMGSSGFGPGNTTPVSEFNVYVDAEAYQIMLNSGIKLTIIGFDVCLGDAALNKHDMEILLKSKKTEAIFSVECNKTLLEYNLERSGEYIVDLPDAVAMGVVIWKEIVLESKECYCHTCLHDEEAYGQIIIYSGEKLAFKEGLDGHKSNAVVCKSLDNTVFKENLMKLLME
jgi:inosine-uridine nucleoside N-ribohydrolase